MILRTPGSGHSPGTGTGTTVPACTTVQAGTSWYVFMQVAKWYHGGLSDGHRGQNTSSAQRHRMCDRDCHGMVRWKAHSQGHTAAYVPRAGIDDIAKTPTNAVPFKVDVDF